MSWKYFGYFVRCRKKLQPRFFLESHSQQIRQKFGAEILEQIPVQPRPVFRSEYSKSKSEYRLEMHSVNIQPRKISRIKYSLENIVSECRPDFFPDIIPDQNLIADFHKTRSFRLSCLQLNMVIHNYTSLIFYF